MASRNGHPFIVRKPKMRPATNLILFVVLLTAVARRAPVSARVISGTETPKSTAQRLRERGWWPTRLDAARKDYVGAVSCAACHKQIALDQQQTPMAHAAWKASETAVLRAKPTISLSELPFQTVITRDREGSTYTVARGGEAKRGWILWSMGDGMMGQTFVLSSGGSLFESELSYFPAINGLDLTPGHSRAAPQDMEDAFGMRESTESAQRCFACHTTASSVRWQFEPAKAIPGVTCEACHGPGARHVKAMQAHQFQKGEDAILDPDALSPIQLVDFCGACHRAPQDVAASKDYFPINVRFQPYRLSKSRCWSQPDPRITCIACHDPHEQLVQDIDSYDEKCLACHASSAAPASSEDHRVFTSRMAPACPVKTSQCVSCHMPRYKVPQMHGVFTDHDIRIVRPGDPYPL